MSIKKIIPCLDMKDCQVVKGIKFEGLKEIGDPLELALRYCDEGADEIAFLDISPSQKSRDFILDLLRKLRLKTNIPLCTGGGINELDYAKKLIDAGASKVSVCSAALKNPLLLSDMAKAFGSGSVMLAIDAKRINNAWNAFSGGGRVDTGLDAVEWAKKGVELGAGEIMLNSIDADGTGEGYDLELCSVICNAVSVPVIASGGAGSLEQIAEVLLKTSVSAALVASFLHYEKSTVKEIKNYLESKGISVKWL